MSTELPSWMPERLDAASLVQELDIEQLRADVTDLVEFALAEDTGFLDSLPEEVESALVTPLLLLGRVNSTNSDPVELVVAAQLVRRSVNDYLIRCPAELTARLMKLPQ